MPDVLILGAGVAGLSTAIELAREGLRVEIIEARDRIGGRVFTQHDPTLNHPIELGAEFVHGMPPEIWLPAQQHHLKMIEVDGDLRCSLGGKLQPCNFFVQADKILAAMNDRDPDESFLDFLARRFPGDDHADAKPWATGYVSGFNAADPAEVSVHWLVRSRNAEEQIQGDRAFRIAGGYQKLIDILAAELATLKLPIHLNTVVSRIQWSKQSVQVKTSGNRMRSTSPVAPGALHRRLERPSADKPAEHSSATRSFAASRVLITLPLGVLESGCIRFTPDLPADKQSALDKLAMGKVVRVTLCFRERFWAGKTRGLREFLSPHETECAKKNLSNLSFLFSRDPAFPTWWTQMPEHLPIITGWAPAHSAEPLAGLSGARIVDKALDSLGSLLGSKKSLLRSRLNTAYFHDWDSDPFSGGAYSYVKVGGEGCQKTLSAPIDNTLFFAGEATDTTGHNGTVHGAIASGLRAAKEILATRK
jgi:monoamine oxidase